MDLNAADPSLPATLEAFIQAGPAALDRARQAVEGAGGSAVQPLGSAQLHAPAVHRPRIACA
ncbi:MAG: 5-oxopent-3-ene-1,2,5-tricarboxylate decarboxylase, partial [Candidatus Dormibacteraeota bacterium]|nr:5-oxopent-3-ene-1,2,5-tricarboxylate decarboxylase [Candidatus Dormibacteraeota bacterium]